LLSNNKKHEGRDDGPSLGKRRSNDQFKDREFQEIPSIAAIRAAVAFRTANALLPDADNRRKMRIARRILSLCDGQDRSRKITESIMREIILRHSQCLQRSCPMLLFTEPIVREINAYFNEEDQ